MAKVKQQPKRILYHQFFCGEGNLGEADGFFSLENGKLEWVDGWDANDANWRSEYMTGLLSWAGVEVKDLPDKYLWEAVALAEKVWGLDYGHEGDEDHPDFEGEQEDVELYFREGTSDKVYNLSISAEAQGEWKVVAEYGRRGGNLKEEIKGEGMDYNDAKTLYDKTLNAKVKKGYKEA